jgi:hypothetical protein
MQFSIIQYDSCFCLLAFQALSLGIILNDIRFEYCSSWRLLLILPVCFNNVFINCLFILFIQYSVLVASIQMDIIKLSLKDMYLVWLHELKGLTGS